MAKFVDEFKQFIMRGNMIDMAVGIVVGGAFKGIVDSLVKDIIMPPIGMLIGGVDFSALKAVLKPAEGEIAEVAINYGMFINTIISFLIIAFVIFVVVKGINTMREKAEAKKKAAEATVEAAAVPEITEKDILTEILAELKKAK